MDDPALQSPLLGGESDGGAVEAQRPPTLVGSKSSVRIANSLVSKASTQTARHSFLVGPTKAERGDEEAGEKADKCCTRFCGLIDAFPIPFVLGGAAIGLAIGIGLSTWNPDDPSAKDVVITWVGLIGDLFIRALKCIVLPLVFVSIAISIMDMLSLGEAGTVVLMTIGLYLLTTVCASLIGVASSVIFSNFYTLTNGVPDEVDPVVRMGCSYDADGMIGSYLTKSEGGSVSCSAASDGEDTMFMMDDVNGYFAKSGLAEGPAQLTLSESIYQGLFMQLIDDNFVGMFYRSNFLGVVVMGAAFGVALSRLSSAPKPPPGIKWDRIMTIQLLEELLEVFMLFVLWIIKCTPFAIISLIAAAIGAQTDIGEVMKQLGYLVAAVVIGQVTQFLIVYCGLYFAFIRKNPLRYYSGMIPAFTMAFASSSSAATLPVSIDCAIASEQVPEGVARFCLPLGATINMDGSAIHIICSCVWLAYNNGIVPTAANYIILVFCATFGSMGAAPVPSASIVLILTSYHTTFGSAGGAHPAGLAYIIAIDWLIDRFSTMFNIGGDLTVAAIAANKVKDDLSGKGGWDDDVPTERGE